MVTLYAAATALKVDADAEFETELERVQQPEVIERCRRRQLEKREALVASPVFCTCGASSGPPFVLDPRLAWRHAVDCPHSKRPP